MSVQIRVARISVRAKEAVIRANGNMYLEFREVYIPLATSFLFRVGALLHLKTQIGNTWLVYYEKDSKLLHWRDLDHDDFQSILNRTTYELT